MRVSERDPTVRLHADAKRPEGRAPDAVLLATVLVRPFALHPRQSSIVNRQSRETRFVEG